MEELAKLEEERRETGEAQEKQGSGTANVKRKLIYGMEEGTASNEMCTFLILNISSLQLIPVNIIAYRAQYGSLAPTAIVGPGIVATLFSTIVAIGFCKVMDR